MINKSENIIGLFFLLVFLNSCSSKIHQYRIVDENNDKEVLEEIILAFDELIEVAKDKKLENFRYISLLPKYRFRLSETILLNKERNKFFSVVYKIGSSNHTSDALYNIYGVKIENKWYLIAGSMLILPRRYYQYDSYEPMTFEELSYLAHEMRHKRYLTKTNDGKYKVNSDMIDKLITPGNLLGFYPGEPRTGDEAWLAVYNRKMSDTLSTEELEQFERSKAKAIEEFVPEQFPKRKKTPIFETKAWKNRHN